MYLQTIPDHPVIRNMERTGYPDGKAPTYPRCPICGEECETVYQSKENGFDIVGCDLCLKPWDAWEAPCCFPEEDE